MTARIVSAGEARGLLEGARSGPYIAGHEQFRPAVFPTSGSAVDVPIADDIQDYATAQLLAAAPDLARTVIALEEERDTLRARVARLERVLAVEDGDESQAPDGWSGINLFYWVKGLYHVGHSRMGWTLARDGDVYLRCYPTALEAMEAADAAMEVTT